MGANNSNQLNLNDKIVTLAPFNGAMKRCAELLEENGSIDYDIILQTLLKCNYITKIVETHFPGNFLLHSFFAFHSKYLTVITILIGANSTETIVNSIKKELTKHGVTAENTLYAQSACPDEINHEEGDITNLLATYLGEVFHMGGLAGKLFTFI